MTDDRRATGLRIRREVLGDAHVDRAVAGTTPFSAAFQDFITRTAWGDVWARPGLDRRTRSAITLAMLTALRAEGEIALHVRAALRNGLTRDEIAEVLLHSRGLRGRAGGQRGVRDRPADARRGRGSPKQPSTTDPTDRKGAAR